MLYTARLIVGAVLLIAGTSSQAATLVNGEVLSFTSAAGSYIKYSTNSGSLNFTFNDSASLNSLDGIVIGTAQPAAPGIDQTWHDTLFGYAGNHYTTSAVTVLSPTTLDFSGWVMQIVGGSTFNVGATQGVANYSFDGTNYTLDYSWSTANNQGAFLNGVLESYQLHLVGIVSTVPTPAAVWLFVSGLLGLIGAARRIKTG